MATAKIRTETTGSVVLTMTEDEATALRTALAHVGWDAVRPVQSALYLVGIDWDAQQEFRPTQNFGCIIAVDKEN